MKDSLFSGKHILIGITGSIAAYKIPELIRQCIELGAHVKVIITEGGKHFVTPDTLCALSATVIPNEIFSDVEYDSMEHITLARWADIVMIAPASANIISGLATGLASDLLLTICLATEATVVVVPAMNKQMWMHPATQNNINTLINRGVHIWGPNEGVQACGEIGPGRMIEPEEIIDHLQQFVSTSDLKELRILISAGPTIEPMDPVRFLSNYSSGRMGYAIAKVSERLGARVTLISGPVKLSLPSGVEVIPAETAMDMLDKVSTLICEHDIFISAAAVSDYRFSEFSQQKIKKSDEVLNIELIKNPDILRTISKQIKPSDKKFLVGFAAETENLSVNAIKKLHDKNLDIIVANDVSHDEYGFDSEFNKVIVHWRNGNITFDLTKKEIIASQLLMLIKEKYDEKYSTEDN